jgi:predicted DNA-binding protein with PD1-like motif
MIDRKVKYINLEDLEIHGLHGTVSINGCHLHISVSDVRGHVMSGHI